jgi:hypothetical protein
MTAKIERKLRVFDKCMLITICMLYDCFRGTVTWPPRFRPTVSEHLHQGTPRAQETPRAQGNPRARGTPRVRETPRAEGTPRAQGTPRAYGTPPTPIKQRGVCWSCAYRFAQPASNGWSRSRPSPPLRSAVLGPLAARVSIAVSSYGKCMIFFPLRS